jgi:hypothetical protein
LIVTNHILTLTINKGYANIYVMSETPKDPLITLSSSASEVLRGVYENIDHLGPGQLRDYFDSPATVMEMRSDPAEADFSNGEAVKENIFKADQAVSEGRIGMVGILSGSVSGNYEADTLGSPNLRSAFAHLDDLFDKTPLGGATEFHKMFQSFDASSADAQIGYIENGAELSSDVGQQLMAAAGSVLRNKRTIAITDASGRPDGILMPLIDPATGELLTNTFLKIHSGIYSTPEGTRSQSAHLAFANLIVLPEGMPEANAAKEEFEAAPSVRVPDAEAIHYLRDGLPKQSLIGGNRRGGNYNSTVMRSTLAEQTYSDGSSEGLTHLLIIGGSVLGVVRSLDADKKLKETRVVALPIGEQAAAYEAGQDTAKTIFALNAETSGKPRAGGKAVSDFEATGFGRHNLEQVFGIKDGFVSADQMEISITGRTAGERIIVNDTNSANGTGVITVDTLMLGGESGLKGMAYESALALHDLLNKQPGLWGAKASQ